MSLEKKYYSIKELSLYTSLPKKTLYEWASLGKIPSIKIGRRILFDLNDFDSFLTSLKRDVKDPDNIAKKIIGYVNDNNL